VVEVKKCKYILGKTGEFIEKRELKINTAFFNKIKSRKIELFLTEIIEILLSFGKCHARNYRKGIEASIVKNAGKNMGWCFAAKIVCD